MVYAMVASMVMITAGSAVVADHPNDIDETELKPGEHVAGVVNVIDAEFAGEIETRSFGFRIEEAGAPDAQAHVAVDQLANIEHRLTEIEEQHEALAEAKETGAISTGKYKAEMARLDTERANVARLADQSQQTINELPTDVREQHNVSEETVGELQEWAAELGGETIAEIAREIAGVQVNHDFSHD